MNIILIILIPHLLIEEYMAQMAKLGPLCILTHIMLN